MIPVMMDRPAEKMYQMSASDDRNLLLQQAAMAQRGLRPQVGQYPCISYGGCVSIGCDLILVHSIYGCI